MFRSCNSVETAGGGRSRGAIPWMVLVGGIAVVCIGTNEAKAERCDFFCDGSQLGDCPSCTQEECYASCTSGLLVLECPDPRRECRFNGALIYPPPPPSVLTVSEWGMAILMLAVALGITLKFRGNLAPRPR